MNLNKARGYFPHLRDGQIYFNHAATGPMSTKVVDVLRKYIEDKSGKNIDDIKGFLKVLTEAKEKLGKMINASSDRIAFIDNTSNGLNILAQGYHWKKGDRILLNNIEFPANVYPFLNLARDGVIVDFVLSKDSIVSVEEIEKNITPETKLISISFVQFLSGYKIDLEKLGKICKDKNIILCVDAIQGLGAVTLDVEKYNIDFISCGTQKWMLGMQGFAFVYVSKKMQEQIDAKYIGWLSVENAWDFLNYDMNFLEDASRYQNGTLNTAGIYALNESLNIFMEFGFDVIEKQIIYNTKYFIGELKKIGIIPLLADCSENNLAGITSFEHPEAERIFEVLKENKISCSVRNGLVRLSPHFYNTEDDIDRVVDLLKKENIKTE